ncbi:cysteine hydrolase family protein [Herbaspirillum huttiense]|uniref:cysteine hydrolase family protein n=1 Tax=Herbaspirillum TaxID=963 RepID=UPI000C096A0E|nr:MULTISPECIES: cysteine hydrolase family protein [unclassified Herbaspirillum]MAF04324.1 cysteine hydrolase [Herbaspirillum sp.]MBO16374.1 cysteine hydrolase [Herbaspirillum sp.]
MSSPQTLIQIAGGSARAATWQEAVLLIIDHQTEYTTGRAPLAGIDAAVGQIAELLRQARAAGAPVIHIVHHSKPGSAMFDPQGPHVAIIDGVQPQGEELVLPKGLPNAFAGTALDEAIKKTGRKSLIVTGFATHMCVSATVRSALDHGYASTVVAAACATRDLPDPLGGAPVTAAEVQRVALTELADRYATVVADAAALAGA